jgi:hypothetical protein
MVSVQEIEKKLRAGEEISADEVRGLVKDLKHFQNVAGYLAACHAATADNLPPSVSRSNKERMAHICSIASKGLSGDITAIARPTPLDHEIEYCNKVATRLRNELGEQAAAKSGARLKPR